MPVSAQRDKTTEEVEQMLDEGNLGVFTQDVRGLLSLSRERLRYTLVCMISVGYRE